MPRKMFLLDCMKQWDLHIRVWFTLLHGNFRLFFRLQFSFSRTKQFNAPIKLSFLALGLVVFHMHAFSFTGAAYTILCFSVSS